MLYFSTQIQTLCLAQTNVTTYFQMPWTTTVNFKLAVQRFWKWVVSLAGTSQPQPKVLGFVWCTLSHCLFPKSMDNKEVRSSANHSYITVTIQPAECMSWASTVFVSWLSVAKCMSWASTVFVSWLSVAKCMSWASTVFVSWLSVAKCMSWASTVFVSWLSVAKCKCTALPGKLNQQ